MEISRETFRQQMEYLELTGYNVIPLRHLYEYVSGKRRTIPHNAVVITLDDGWRSTYTEAWPELKKRNWPFTVFVYPNIIGRTANALTWKQIREMSDEGVDIQSHSLSHPYLTRGRQGRRGAQYDEWLAHELAESKRLLEQNTGRPVSYLAYPYGDYDSSVVSTAARAGYKAALTCEFGPVRRGSDPLRMRRFVIDGRMTFADFRRHVGALPMQLAEMTPAPGKPAGMHQRVLSARIARHETMDPKSVGMAILGMGASFPFAYDARTGAISLTIRKAAEEMKGKVHRAVVWATDSHTGKRFEATWTFRFGSPEAPQEFPVARPAASTFPPTAPASVATLKGAGAGVKVLTESHGKPMRAQRR